MAVKHLLPKVPRYFKTNLHTHSNLSDGELTPQEVKAAYQERGYSVVALTDHNIIVDHSDMNDPDFLMLTGVEININETASTPSQKLRMKAFHMNLIAKKADNLWQPVPVSTKRDTTIPYRALVQAEDMERVHTPEAINAMIARANEKGFLVMYNHPRWSLHTYADYSHFEGLWGVEIRNTECCCLGYNENCSHVYQELLMQGKQMFPTATDDTHNPSAIGGSWIMVGARKLAYPDVIEALENGDFYASCGPEIHELTMEGDMLRIRCSDAAQITVETQGRSVRRAVAEEGALTWAEFDLASWKERSAEDPNAFFRLTVTAADGTYAATRAYWLNEL